MHFFELIEPLCIRQHLTKIRDTFSASLFCEAAMKMQYTGAAVVLVALIAVTSSARLERQDS